MRLVKDWKKSWKWFSVNAMVWAVAIQGSWAFIPDDMKASLPDGLVTASTVTLLALGVIGRLVDQDDQ